MSLRGLSVADWARMDDGAAQAECEALARALPHGLKLDDLRMHEYGGRTHRIARFSRREAGDLVQFVLVPGGEVALGFDGHDFKPSYWQTVSFAESAKEYDFEPSIVQFVDAQTSPRRTAYLPPILVEVEAQEVAPRRDFHPVSEDDPVFQKFRDEYPHDVKSRVPWRRA